VLPKIIKYDDASKEINDLETKSYRSTSVTKKNTVHKASIRFSKKRQRREEYEEEYNRNPA
jgi:hypothetical protein